MMLCDVPLHPRTRSTKGPDCPNDIQKRLRSPRQHLDDRQHSINPLPKRPAIDQRTEFVRLVRIHELFRLEERLVGFADRLERLPRHEGKIVKRALTSLGAIPTLSDNQFDELGRAVLGAWEHGRLAELIAEIADSEALDESALLEVLMEARVLTALQTVEVVRTKLEAIQGLRKRIEEKELENAVRDFIAKSPWLISAEWETFKKESGLRQIIEEAADTAKLSADVYRGRVDLTLASGQHLLILEFVRPGQAVDWDHFSRFERYVRSIRSRIETTTGASFRQVTGYIVADELDGTPEFADKIKGMVQENMYAFDCTPFYTKQKQVGETSSAFSKSGEKATSECWNTSKPVARRRRATPRSNPSRASKHESRHDVSARRKSLHELWCGRCRVRQSWLPVRGLGRVRPTQTCSCRPQSTGCFRHSGRPPTYLARRGLGLPGSVRWGASRAVGGMSPLSKSLDSQREQREGGICRLPPSIGSGRLWRAANAGAVVHHLRAARGSLRSTSRRVWRSSVSDTDTCAGPRWRARFPS